MQFTVGDLRVDLGGRRVTIQGRETHLTPLEYRVLVTLVNHAGRVVSPGQLLLEVWGPRRAAQVHLLQVHIAQLRRKLEADPRHPAYLRTEPGVGYRLSGANPTRPGLPKTA